LDKADGAADVELLLQLQGQLNPPVAAPAIATAPAASSEPKPGTQISCNSAHIFGVKMSS
jgi:hypothetical protein